MSVKNRSVNKVFETVQTMEGAGVSLKRVFSHKEAELLDPFLLLDHFGSEDPEDWVKGFPWHPHRGMETITYVMEGKVRHGDSLGNEGMINKGSVQWMTAGSGIIHEEMPEIDKGVLWGLQLWANLPKDYKMMTPRYRDVRPSEIPIYTFNEGVTAKIIAGELNGVKGPIGPNDVIIKPQYFDIAMKPHQEFTIDVPEEHTVFNYIYHGQASFGQDEKNIGDQHLIVYHEGNKLTIRTEEEGAKFLTISGKPLKEPIAWYGPIVMNTQDEIYEAVNEFQTGEFIKHKPKH